MRDILQLRYVRFAVAAVVDQQRKDVVELFARVRWIQTRQFAVDRCPRGDLLFGVRHMRYRLIVTVLMRDVGEFLSTLSIENVTKARMIRVQLRSVGENAIGELIEIANLPWKPGN